MKTLKNGNIAFYRSDRMMILGAFVIGWIPCFLIFYPVIEINKQAFYIFCFMLLVALLILIMSLLQPVLIVSPQGIEQKKHTMIFWNQIAFVYYPSKTINPFAEPVFVETVEGPVGIQPTEEALIIETVNRKTHVVRLMKLSSKDRKCLFGILQKHNLSVQERPLKNFSI